MAKNDLKLSIMVRKKIETYLSLMAKKYLDKPFEQEFVNFSRLFQIKNWIFLKNFPDISRNL
jgi:hypothetical protein